MNPPWALWLRRSVAVVAFPAMVVAGLIVVFSRNGWQYEWGWSSHVVAVSSMLLAPLAAGVTAHEQARRLAPSMTLIARGSARGLRSLLVPMFSAVVVTLAAILVVAVVVIIRVLPNHPTDRPDFAIAGMLLVSLLAAASLGAAVGAWLPTLAAGPIAAIGVYLVAAMAASLNLGLDGFFAVTNAGGSTLGLRLRPEWVAGFIAAHSLLFLAGIALFAAATRVIGRRTLIIVAVACVLAAGVCMNVANSDPNRLVDSHEPVRCVGDRPRVCGPESATKYLTIAASGLNDAYQRLEKSGLPLVGSYHTMRAVPGNRFPPDSGLLWINPELFVDGRYGFDDLVEALQSPRLCADLMGNTPPTKTISAQGTVARWLSLELRRDSSGPAPSAVRQAYQYLVTCPPYRGPLR